MGLLTGNGHGDYHATGVGHLSISCGRSFRLENHNVSHGELGGGVRVFGVSDELDGEASVIEEVRPVGVDLAFCVQFVVGSIEEVKKLS